MNPTERASHPSRVQVETLLDFLESNPSLAKGFSKVPSLRETARKSWEKVTLQLNSMGGCVKSWKQWTKYWADKKSAVKKKAILRARNKAGSGPEVVEMSSVEERILTLMGGESFALSDSHVGLLYPFENPLTITDDCEQSSYNIDLIVASHNTNTMTTEQPSDIITCAPDISHSCTRQSGRIATPSPPKVVVPRNLSSGYLPARPPLPSKPSGFGIHPPRRTENARHQLVVSPLQDHPPSPITTNSTRLRQRRRWTVSHPSQRESNYTRMTKQFLKLEQQRIEVDRRNMQLLESIINRESERNSTSNQALLAIGEGLKLLAEALKK